MSSSTLPDTRKPTSSGHAPDAGTPTLRAWLRDPIAWLVILSCLGVVVLSTASIARSLDRDEGAFLAIARLVLEGHVPYRDVFDQKGPAIYYYLAAVLAAFPGLSPLGQITVARLGVVGVNLLTAVGLVQLGRRWWRLEVGLLAACLWLICLPLYGGDQFFTEPFAAAAVVWALFVALRWPGVRGALSAGMLVALGALFKQTAILALPGVALAILAPAPTGQSWWRPYRVAGARGGALVAGFCLPWVLVGALFALTGGLGALLDQVVVANLVRYPADPPSAVLAGIHADISAAWAFWLLCALAIVATLVRWIGIPRMPRRAPTLAFWVTLLLVVLNLVPLKAHAYSHYLLQVLPWAALLVAAGCVPLFALWRAALLRARGTQGAGVPRVLLAPLVLAGLVLLLTAPSQLPPTQWQVDSVEAQREARAGAWIASYVPPRARLLVAPADPGYYFLARRDPAVPYVYMLPINLSPALLAQATTQVRARQFAVIVWQTGGSAGGQQPEFAALYAALTSTYHVVAADQRLGLTIYQANACLPDAGPCGSTRELTRQ